MTSVDQARDAMLAQKLLEFATLDWPEELREEVSAEAMLDVSNQLPISSGADPEEEQSEAPELYVRSLDPARDLEPRFLKPSQRWIGPAFAYAVTGNVESAFAHRSDVFTVSAIRTELQLREIWPFDLVDQTTALQYHEFELRALLARARDKLITDVDDRIDRRLSVLLDPDDWEEGDAFPDFNSFERLLRFLADHFELRPPSVFLSRRGYFDASWRTSRDKLASMEFHPNGTVSWMVFAPSPINTDNMEEAAGDTQVELVLRRIEDYGALEWMRREA